MKVRFDSSAPSHMEDKTARSCTCLLNRVCCNGISFEYYVFRHYWLVDKLAKSLAFEARICRFEAYRASQEYNRGMEREELQHTVDELFDRVDQGTYEVMNRILEYTRDPNSIPESTRRSLGQSALQGLESPKIPEK